MCAGVPRNDGEQSVEPGLPVASELTSRYFRRRPVLHPFWRPALVLSRVATVLVIVIGTSPGDRASRDQDRPDACRLLIDCIARSFGVPLPLGDLHRPARDQCLGVRRPRVPEQPDGVPGSGRRIAGLPRLRTYPLDAAVSSVSRIHSASGTPFLSAAAFQWDHLRSSTRRVRFGVFSGWPVKLGRPRSCGFFFVISVITLALRFCHGNNSHERTRNQA